MTDTLYTIRLEDQVTANAARVAAAMRGVADASQRVADAAHSQDRAYQAVARQAAKFAGNELRAARALAAVDRAALKATKTLGGLGKIQARFKGVAGAAAGLAGVFSSRLIGVVFETGRGLLEAAGHAQILERNFARVTGDPTELAETRELIKKLGLDLAAGEEAALKLRTTFGRFTAEALLKTFSALSLMPDEIKRASLALSQIQGKGKMQAEELNQFVEAVPGVDRGQIIAQLAKELKITTAEAADRLGKGQIRADVGVRALVFGALESQKIKGNQRGDFSGVDRTVAAGANDINRQLTALDNTVLELRRAFGSAIASPAVIASIQALTRALDAVSKWDPRVLQAMAFAAGGLALALGTLGAVAGAVFLVSTAVSVLTGTLIPAAAAAWAFLAPILVAAAPFIAAGAAIALLVYQIRELMSAWDGDLLAKTIVADVKALGAFFLDMHVQAYSWGANLISGLIDGIVAKAGEAVAKIREVGAGVIGAAKDVFGIHSPSTVFAEQGRYLDEGLALGIEDHQELAFQSAETMADGVISEVDMLTATGAGINQGALMNVGAAAGAAVASSGGGSGGGGGASIGQVSVAITVEGSRGADNTVDAIREFFELEFAALLERQLEAQGA